MAWLGLCWLVGFTVRQGSTNSNGIISRYFLWDYSVSPGKTPLISCDVEKQTCISTALQYWVSAWCSAVFTHSLWPINKHKQMNSLSYAEWWGSGQSPSSEWVPKVTAPYRLSSNSCLQLLTPPEGRMNRRITKDFQDTKLFCMVLWWWIHITHLSKPIECITPRANPNVNQRLWLIMAC